MGCLLWIFVRKGTDCLIDWYLFPLDLDKGHNHMNTQHETKTMWVRVTKITQWQRNRTKGLFVFTGGVLNRVQWMYTHNIHINMTTHINMFMGIHIHSHIYTHVHVHMDYAVPSDPIQMQSVILKFQTCELVFQVHSRHLFNINP